MNQLKRPTYVAPLDVIPVKGCLNHPYHPSVVYVKGGFAGHKWWMAQTPFPPFEDMDPYVDRYELPCIHYSDDGLKWYPIANNPIDELTQDEIEQCNYFSDPHLILRDGCLELYYRYTILQNKSIIGNKTLLYRRTSKDGIHWSERELVADLRKEADVAIWGEQIISQAVLWKDGQYNCWYVDASSHIWPRGVRVVTSQDGVHWTKYQQCTFTGDESLQPWHIDVQYYQGKYHMVMYDMKANSLSWYQSEDAIIWVKKGDLLTPSHKCGDFYAEGLYRACSVWAEDKIRVYFSSQNDLRSAIGLLESKDGTHFEIKNGSNGYLYTIRTQLTFKTIAFGAWIKHAIQRVKRKIKRMMGVNV